MTVNDKAARASDKGVEKPVPPPEPVDVKLRTVTAGEKPRRTLEGHEQAKNGSE